MYYPLCDWWDLGWFPRSPEIAMNRILWLEHSTQLEPSLIEWVFINLFRSRMSRVFQVDGVSGLTHHKLNLLVSNRKSNYLISHRWPLPTTEPFKHANITIYCLPVQQRRLSRLNYPQTHWSSVPLPVQIRRSENKNKIIYQIKFWYFSSLNLTKLVL